MIVPREQLVRGVMRTRVDDDIRHWAKRRVVASQHAIDTQRRQAMCKGYRDGMAAALEDVVAHWMRTEHLCEQWRSEMIGQVRELLGSASRHPQALLAALDDAMTALAGGQSDAPLVIVLPLRLKPRRDEIRARVQAVSDAPLTLEFRATDERILVMRGSAVVEYDPHDYAKRAEAALDLDPRVPEQDLHALLAACLTALAGRVDELSGARQAQSPDTQVSQVMPFTMEREDDDRY
uniref:Oxygen-regulated invasion protein OrgB n=1 Tax=Pandoraea faecigallinarum TaxID=656179 RepID=A0A0H3WVS9_9BURK